MRTYTLIALLGLLPLAAVGQTQELDPPRSAARELGASRSAARDLEGTNATTLAVLRANCPKGMNEAEWLKLMEIPANRTLFPLRVTQGMLDTLDAKKLDLGYSYVLVNNSSQMH